MQPTLETSACKDLVLSPNCHKTTPRNVAAKLLPPVPPHVTRQIAAAPMALSALRISRQRDRYGR
jgi:hypothetical protein